MKIELYQISSDKVSDIKFHWVIGASGFEKRATFQASEIPLDFHQAIAIGFNNEDNDPIREENDRIFESLNYRLVKEPKESEREFFENLFEEYLKNFKSDREINIYVDYSSMTRNWYAQILLNSIKLAQATSIINIYFGYSFAKYVHVVKEEKLNQIVEPLYGYCKLSIPYKPTALVICLGNEVSRVYGLREFFDATTYLLYSDPKFGNEYSIEVESLNSDILENTSPNHIFKYPIDDLIYSDQLLENLCRTLSESYRVIIAPCGPKPFTLLALINSIKLDNDIEVWRISPGKDLQKHEREANGKISLLHFRLCKE